MDIKNELLKKYLEDIKNEEITLKKIDDFGRAVDFEVLSEFFDLIEKGEVELHALKLYSIVYDSSLIAEVSTKKPLNYIDMIFAAMWSQEIEEESADDIVRATLGFVMFGTDFLKRVKNGYKQLSYDSTKLETQIKDVVSVYKRELENDSFIRSLSQEDSPNDSELLHLEMEELDSIKKIKNRIEFSDIAYKYEESDSKEIKIALLEQARQYNEKEGEYSFLPNNCLNIFSDLKIKKNLLKADTDYAEEPKHGSLLNNLSSNDLSEDIDYEDLEVIAESETGENAIIKGLKNLLSTKKDKKKDRGQDFKNLTMKSTASKKTNSFKHTILMIFVLAILGLGFTAITQKDKINDDESIAEKIVGNQVESKKFEINRAGSNSEDNK